MTWLDTLREGRSLVLRLAVHTGLDDVPDQIWEVGSQHTRGFSLVEFEFTDWTLADDHVLLVGPPGAVQPAQFHRPGHEARRCPLEALPAPSRGRVAVDPVRAIHEPGDPGNCLSTGSGVLADGPDRLLREYAAVLREKRSRALLSLSATAGPPVG